MYAQETVKPYRDDSNKRTQVERMFNSIAHSYDNLNHTLSLGVDRLWRRAAIRPLEPLARDGKVCRVLDIATGTGDLALLAARRLHTEEVIGADIADSMLHVARCKAQRTSHPGTVTFTHADCAALPYEADTFDAVISAFALRNFADLDRCLEEMRRVTRPGGTLSVIDLCAPTTFPMRQFFWLYSHVMMPCIGRLISYDDSAYTYLPASMSAIPQGEVMAQIIRKAGWREVAYRRLVFDMCIRYTAVK